MNLSREAILYSEYSLVTRLTILLDRRRLGLEVTNCAENYVGLKSIWWSLACSSGTRDLFSRPRIILGRSEENLKGHVKWSGLENLAGTVVSHPQAAEYCADYPVQATTVRSTSFTYPKHK